MTTPRVKDLIAALVALDNCEAEIFVSDAETDASYSIDPKVPVVLGKEGTNRVYVSAFITAEEDE